jgi:uncharacterized protein YPO0396
MEDIDKILENYEPGKPENKPDVTKQLKKIKEEREIMIKEHMEKQIAHNDTLNKLQMMSNPASVQNTINEQSFLIQQLTIENGQLKDKVQYLENKIKQIINERLQEKMAVKQQQLM